MSGPVSDPKLICEMFRPCPHGLRPNACPYCLQPQTDAHQPWWKCGVLIGVGPLALGRQPPDDWVILQRVLPQLDGLPYPEVVASEVEKLDTTWWNWPRGPHSAKPPAFLDMVERVSPGPYVELFARAPRLGWDHWGHGYEIGESA